MDIVTSAMDLNQDIVAVAARHHAAFEIAAEAYDAAFLSAEMAKIANNRIVNTATESALYAGGAYLFQTFKEAPSPEQASALLDADFPARQPSDRSPSGVDRGGAIPTGDAPDDETGFSGNDFFDPFDDNLGAFGYAPPATPDSPGAAPLDAGNSGAPTSLPWDAGPDDAGPMPDAWPVGSAEPAPPAPEPTPEPEAPSEPETPAASPSRPASNSAPTPRPLTVDDIDEDDELLEDELWLLENGNVQGGDRTDDDSAPPEEDGEPDEPDAGAEGEDEMPSPVDDPQMGSGPSYPNYNRASGPGTVRPAEDYVPMLAAGSLFTAVNAANRPNGSGAVRPADDAIVQRMSSFDLTAFRAGGANPGNITPVDPMIGDLGGTPGGTMPTRGGANDPRAAFDGLAIALGGIGF